MPEFTTLRISRPKDKEEAREVIADFLVEVEPTAEGWAARIHTSNYWRTVRRIGANNGRDSHGPRTVSLSTKHTVKSCNSQNIC